MYYGVLSELTFVCMSGDVDCSWIENKLSITIKPTKNYSTKLKTSLI